MTEYEIRLRLTWDGEELRCQDFVCKDGLADDVSMKLIGELLQQIGGDCIDGTVNLQEES